MKRSQLFVAITAAIVAVPAVILAVVDINSSQTKASSSSKLVTSKLESKFSFDTAKVSSWRQGPNNGTSLALFSNDHSCFASIEYKTGTVDIAAALQKSQASLAKDGYTSVAASTVPAMLQLNRGSKQYELHQYSITGAGSAGQLYGGQEYGYVLLADGYLFVQGYCNTADQLVTTIDALQAIKFDESK